MSATWNILTFTVPGKQHILHCVPSAPLRFSKGAKTTTQLGRLHPSLWRKDPVLICRVSLLSFNSCSQNQSPKQKTPAQWHTNLQPWRTKIPAISCGTRIICEVCLSGRNTKTTVCSGHLRCLYCDVSTEVDWRNTSGFGPADCWAWWWWWWCAGKSSDILNTHSHHRLIQDVSGWQSLSGLSEFAGLIWWALRKRQDLLYCYDNSIITHQYLFALCLCFEAICVRGKWMTSCTATITLHLLHGRSWFHAGVSAFWLVADWLMKEIIISKEKKKPQWELNWCTSCSLFIKSSFYLKDKFSDCLGWKLTDFHWILITST